MSLTPDRVALQVLVCAYGQEGIQRFASGNPPAQCGVEYIVSWQLSESDMESAVPESLKSRPDIHIYKSATKGLCVNRNLAMSHATAPVCLIADDDVVYNASYSFRTVIDVFSQHPDVDVACFKSACLGRELKPYPSHPVAVGDAPKGWYVTSFEIAFRLDSPAGRTRFNEYFGIGSPTIFQAGEEDIWLYDVRKAGASVWIFPYTLCEHNHDTTHEKHCREDWFVMTSGAVHSRLHPYTWPLRCLLHAFSQRRMSRWHYFMLCIRGAKTARSHACFR